MVVEGGLFCDSRCHWGLIKSNVGWVICGSSASTSGTSGGWSSPMWAVGWVGHLISEGGRARPRWTCNQILSTDSGSSSHHPTLGLRTLLTIFALYIVSIWSMKYWKLSSLFTLLTLLPPSTKFTLFRQLLSKKAIMLMTYNMAILAWASEQNVEWMVESPIHPTFGWWVMYGYPLDCYDC